MTAPMSEHNWSTTNWIVAKIVSESDNIVNFSSLEQLQSFYSFIAISFNRSIASRSRIALRLPVVIRNSCFGRHFFQLLVCYTQLSVSIVSLLQAVISFNC